MSIVPYDQDQHNAVVARNQAVIDLKTQVFQVGIHFGEPYKGAGKPTLLKPGAELIMARFQLWPRFIERTTIERWDVDAPIFHYRYECQLVHRVTGEVWGAGIGSCNSMEDKYRWRKVARKCPNCGVEAIKRSGFPDNVPLEKRGWYCHSKIGGCNAKFNADDQRIISQEEGKVPNDDVFTLVNTLDKMAQKRALVAAILVATGASAYFTQDVEDFAGYQHAIVDPDGEVIEGTFTPTVTSTKESEAVEEAAPPASKTKAASKAAKVADEFGPTIRKTWRDVSAGLLKQHISALPEGVNIGAIIYPAATGELGYADDDAVKAALNVASLKDVDGTLEELMYAVIVASPAMAQSAEQQTLPGTPKRNAGT